ncbi:MAG: hypothetical protein KKD28_14220 [Chloroflexi bacterium]|nr:hypothetical protein [Chloroflexota bacterium]
MLQLTLDANFSAEILGMKSEEFLEFAEREHLAGIIKLDDGWRVSIFTLAHLLNTAPDMLLDFIEDNILGRMIERVEDDEYFEAQEGWKVYQSYLSEAEK